MVGGFTALYTQTSSSVLAYSNSYLASRRVRSPPGAVCGSAATVVGVRRPFLRQQTATRVAQQLGEVISDDVGTSTADIQEQLAADQQLAAALEELPAVRASRCSKRCSAGLCWSRVQLSIGCVAHYNHSTCPAASCAPFASLRIPPTMLLRTPHRQQTNAQEVPPEALTDFAHELEEDLASVAVTLTAVTGVIIFWRGVWSLLDCELLLTAHKPGWYAESSVAKWSRSCRNDTALTTDTLVPLLLLCSCVPVLRSVQISLVTVFLVTSAASCWAWPLCWASGCQVSRCPPASGHPADSSSSEQQSLYTAGAEADAYSRRVQQLQWRWYHHTATSKPAAGARGTTATPQRDLQGIGQQPPTLCRLPQ